jgi:hypothetical protein
MYTNSEGSWKLKEATPMERQFYWLMGLNRVKGKYYTNVHYSSLDDKVLIKIEKIPEKATESATWKGENHEKRLENDKNQLSHPATQNPVRVCKIPWKMAFVPASTGLRACRERCQKHCF